MRFVVLCVGLLACAGGDGYPEAADTPFEKRVPSFFAFREASGDVLERVDADDAVVDLAACLTTVFAAGDGVHRPFAIAHPRADGRTCEIWMGTRLDHPPRLYCQFDREGEVRVDVARGSVDRTGCFPLVTRVPDRTDLEAALLVPVAPTPAGSITVDLGACKETRYVAGASFATVRAIDETFFESPAACEVYLNNGRYCAFPPYSSIEIERIDGELAVTSTRCFSPEY